MNMPLNKISDKDLDWCINNFNSMASIWLAEIKRRKKES